jgi:hypothetical protein
MSDKPICKLCGKEYYKLYNLKRHIVTIHGFNYQEYLESFDELIIRSRLNNLLILQVK